MNSSTVYSIDLTIRNQCTVNSMRSQRRRKKSFNFLFGHHSIACSSMLILSNVMDCVPSTSLFDFPKLIIKLLMQLYSHKNCNIMNYFLEKKYLTNAKPRGIPYRVTPFIFSAMLCICTISPKF